MVPSIAVLKFFMSAMNSSSLTFLNIETFSSYVSNAAESGFRRILILMMSHPSTSSITALVNGIGGISICAYTSTLSHLGLV